MSSRPATAVVNTVKSVGSSAGVSLRLFETVHATRAVSPVVAELGFVPSSVTVPRATV